MAQQFVDQDGVEHFDDSTIENSDGFLRRIPEGYWNFEKNRLTTGAFMPEGMSFCLESLISPQEFHAFFPTQGLIRLMARQLRSEGEVLERDHYGELKWQLAHVISWGKRKKTIKKKIKNMAEIIFPPPDQNSP